MLVFWWSGKGYQTALVILATLGAAGVGLQLAHVDSLGGNFYWSGGLILAAVVNWFVGSNANKLRISKLKPFKLRNRLLYKAHHRFMSLPMETFSIVIIILAGFVMVTDLR